MRYKLICCAVVLGMLLCAVVMNGISQQSMAFRYHQHLEQPGEAELGAPPQTDAELVTHLPILRIETGGQPIPGLPIYQGEHVVAYQTAADGSKEILAHIETIEKVGQYHTSDDAVDLSGDILLRYRGNSSRNFSKHSYSIKLVEADDPTRNRDLPLLGMSPDHEWALHGPFLDKTLIRNYMWMNLSGQIMGYAPNVRFCEILIDGEYQGVYLLMETISEGDFRVDLSNYREGDPFCSYIIRIGGKLNPQKTVDTFSLYTGRLEFGKETEILYPTTLMQTQSVKDYVEADYSSVEHLLYSADMFRDDDAYRRQIDVKSFVDFYILQEFLANNDVFSESTYFYRDVRGTLHIGPVWDYNNVLDNYIKPLPAEDLILSQRGWYSRLMSDEYFVDRVVERYRHLRKDLLSDESLLAYIDDTIAYLGSAVERNDEVWGYSYDPLLLAPTERRRFYDNKEDLSTTMTREEQDARINEVNPHSYEEAVENMQSYMLMRAAWMDRHIDSLYQYCQPSKNRASMIE